jgi:hypothetical protein
MPGPGELTSHGLDLADVEAAANGFQTNLHHSLGACGDLMT